jgi:hypothetical protein
MAAVLLLGGLCHLASAHAEAKRFALVIGNQAYSGSFGPLQNPVKDAEAIAQTLTSLGFEVLLRTNVDRTQLREVRSDFEQRLKANPNSVALVYFSGHGLQANNGGNYIIPVQANIRYYEDIDEEGIAITKVLEDINAQQPQLTIFIVDACRIAVQLQSRTKGRVKGTMGAMNSSQGSLLAFAASPDQYALDFVNESDEHSPYTAALLNNLTNPAYDIETVFKEARKQVIAKTEGQQIPMESSLLLDSFRFVATTKPVNATVQPVISQTVTPSSISTETAAKSTPITELDGWITIDHYQVKGGLVKDTQTGLMWIRCSLGQTWDGSTCTGNAKTYTWDEAMAVPENFEYAGFSDWRVPDIDELKSLMYCSSGKRDDYTCIGNYTRPTIIEAAFPGVAELAMFWSSSPNDDGGDGAWTVYFGYGIDGWFKKSFDYQVRLVRSGQ